MAPVTEPSSKAAAEQLSGASILRHACVAGIPLAGTIAALALWAFGWAPGAREISLLAAFYVLNMLGMELALHRYFAHRSFKTGRGMRTALAILGSLAYMGPLIWWVAIHRIHHARSDEPGDPHTPRTFSGTRGWLKGLLHGHVGWLFDPRSARPAGWNQFGNDLYREETLLRIHMAYDQWLALGLFVPAVIGGVLGGTWSSALLGFLWGGTVRVFLATNAVWAVNSLCHFGKKAQHFETGDQSRNRWWLAMLTLGAGWHNNHHAFPQYATTRLRWWEIDMSGWVISALERLGLIWDVRRPDRDTHGPIERPREERS